jgi:hypothetical protein
MTIKIMLFLCSVQIGTNISDCYFSIMNMEAAYFSETLVCLLNYMAEHPRSE